MVPQLTPQEALNNVAQVCDAAALNGPDRRTIDTSLNVLRQQIETVESLQEANMPKRLKKTDEQPTSESDSADKPAADEDASAKE